MGPDLQDLVDEAARITAMAVTLEDREFNLVAFCSHRTVGDDVRRDSILTRRSTSQVRRYYESFGIARADGPVRIPADVQRGRLGRVCVPVRWQSVTYGYLWLLEDHSVDPALLPELLDLAKRAGVELARHARLRDDLGWKVGELLSTYPETRAKAAREIAESWSKPEATPVAAVVLRSAAGPSAAAPVNAWRLPRTVLVGTGELGSTFVVPLTAPGDLSQARSVASTALAALAPPAADAEHAPEHGAVHAAVHGGHLAGGAEHAAVVAGIGGPVGTLAEARESWLQARIAARVAASGGTGPLEWPELGVYRLLGVAADPQLRGAVAQPGIDRLLHEGGEELVRTALTYLDEAGSAQRTAQALGIHRQTLYHRLERIEKISGLDLDSGSDRLALHLALTLLPRLG
ncbi:MAG TPA: helix-turn-helix domain-containing protein [Actinospica sp.]|nr:helix-turn-helix domain-containing protein [Actinospica sp.]